MSVLRDLDLTGKVALVTGGSRGLGLSVAAGLGELGSKVALVARKADELSAAGASLAERGVEQATFQADLSNLDGLRDLVDDVVKRFGRIDILVNNAAASWVEPAETHSLQGWRKVMGVNVDAVFALTQEVGRREFIPRRAGKIVNIASIGGLRGNRPEIGASTLAYSTSKGAIVNFTRALATEWGKYNINVNAICPGFFRSRFADSLIAKAETQLVAATPLGRLASDNDFTAAAVFLASEASRHMTGQMMVIDGGMIAA